MGALARAGLNKVSSGRGTAYSLSNPPPGSFPLETIRQNGICVAHQEQGDGKGSGTHGVCGAWESMSMSWS